MDAKLPRLNRTPTWIIAALVIFTLLMAVLVVVSGFESWSEPELLTATVVGYQPADNWTTEAAPVLETAEGRRLRASTPWYSNPQVGDRVLVERSESSIFGSVRHRIVALDPDQ